MSRILLAAQRHRVKGRGDDTWTKCKFRSWRRFLRSGIHSVQGQAASRILMGTASKRSECVAPARKTSLFLIVTRKGLHGVPTLNPPLLEPIARLVQPEFSVD